LHTFKYAREGYHSQSSFLFPIFVYIYPRLILFFYVLIWLSLKLFKFKISKIVPIFQLLILFYFNGTIGYYFFIFTFGKLIWFS
jgi:hypothetical protein